MKEKIKKSLLLSFFIGLLSFMFIMPLVNAGCYYQYRPEFGDSPMHCTSTECVIDIEDDRCIQINSAYCVRGLFQIINNCDEDLKVYNIHDCQVLTEPDQWVSSEDISYLKSLNKEKYFIVHPEWDLGIFPPHNEYSKYDMNIMLNCRNDLQEENCIGKGELKCEIDNFTLDNGFSLNIQKGNKTYLLKGRYINDGNLERISKENKFTNVFAVIAYGIIILMLALIIQAIAYKIKTRKKSKK